MTDTIRTTLACIALALTTVTAAAQAADAPGKSAKATQPDANRSDAAAPVAAPETDPAMANSGALVPGQPVRPEGTEEASVPKTGLDKSSANTADVGTDKKNDKSMRPGSGGDGSKSPNR
ncbi:MAG: hypothetical protein ACREUE_00960 [Panacagrimonas sp.]